VRFRSEFEDHQGQDGDFEEALETERARETTGVAANQKAMLAMWTSRSREYK
jgi:hypothetical protein